MIVRSGDHRITQAEDRELEGTLACACGGRTTAQYDGKGSEESVAGAVWMKSLFI